MEAITETTTRDQAGALTPNLVDEMASACRARLDGGRQLLDDAPGPVCDALNSILDDVTGKLDRLATLASQARRQGGPSLAAVDSEPSTTVDDLEEAILWLRHLKSLSDAAAMSAVDGAQARECLWSVGHSLGRFLEDLERIHAGCAGSEGNRSAAA